MTAGAGRPRGGRPVTGDEPLSYFEHFALRVLQDALSEATAAYWLRRAEQLEAARPRLGDFRGQATRADLVNRDRELAALAQACRNRAALGDTITVAEFLALAPGAAA